MNATPFTFAPLQQPPPMKSLLILLPALLLPLGLRAYGPAQPDWRIVNDTVMGGVSQSSALMLEEGLVRFAGILSLDNNGGFASLRADDPTFAFPGRGTLVLKVRGDGRTYTADLRTARQRGGSSWKQPIQTTSGIVTEHRLPLEDFYATRFGRRIPLAGQLDPSQVRSFGFTLADKHPGPFRLDVLEVAFEPGTPRWMEPVAPDSPEKLITLAITRGVPLFNRGDHDACVAVYEVTARALLLLPEADLPGDVRDRLRHDMAELDPHHTAIQRAWALRHALDRVAVAWK